MTNIKDLALTELVDAVFYESGTGNLWFTLDELQNWTLNNAEESSNVTGRQGRLITTIKRNKATTLSGTNGLVSAGLLEAQTGSKFSNGVTTVQWTDYLTVASNKATTKYVAVGTQGAEIQTLYIKANDGTIGTELTQAGTAASGKFAYDTTTKELTFNTGDLADGTEIVVFYKRQITANVLKVSSGKLSGNAIAYVNALAEDTCGNVYRVQFYFPNMKFSGNFSLGNGGEQTTHGFEGTAGAGGCSNGGDQAWTYTIFGANTEDTPST